MNLHPSCQIKDLELIYNLYFGDKKLFFVEVGALDGKTYSNTWGMNWDGILIEPQLDMAEQCKTNQSQCTVICCACGDHEGEIDLILKGDVSTTKLSKWNRDWGMDETTPTINVPLKKLETILQENNIGYFDLLIIDVEEAEIEVLKGFDLEAHKPKMIIIELHEGQGTNPDQKGYQEPWVTEYLKGYRKIYVDNINTIYSL